MRILHVIPFLWSGAGDVLTRLALSQKQNATVAVVTSGRSKGESDWESYRTRLNEAGIEHFEIDLFNRDPAVFWQSVSRLRETIAEFSPDLVHCHAGVPSAAAAVVRDSGSKQFTLIGTLNSWGQGRPDWMDTMDLWGFGRCDRLHCISEDYRQILIRSGIAADRIGLIPWGLALDKIRASSSENELSQSSLKRLGFVGRIEPRKGQLPLVEAFDRLRQAGTDANLELIGPIADPDYARQIQTTIKARKLDDHVVMRGRVPNVYSDLSRWDVFVSLSSDEGQGMAILEAMALGVPVVSTDIPGVRDFLKHQENGLVVDPPSPERVAETLSWALSHQEETQALATRAKDMVDSRYRWETTVNSMESFYALAT
jgi:glycogen(starch) synthase